VYDTIILHTRILDGSGAPEIGGDVAIEDGRIAAIGHLDTHEAREVIDGTGKMLSPGFIDTHTHDDIVAIRSPEMLPKLSQGVTTVIAGNCGISAAPFGGRGGTQTPPDPMSLLGAPETFEYKTFASYVDAVHAARPAVNIASFVGHTTLRGLEMPGDLHRAATASEIERMREQLAESLDAGALGLSTGLAYHNANSAPTDEVMALSADLHAAGGSYATHLRTELGDQLGAMDEAYAIGAHARTPIVVSHLKCAGVANWGRSPEVLASIERAANAHVHDVGWDCYPYAASSSLLDLQQVTDKFDILITWSTPHPDASGRLLATIAREWGVSLMDAAKRLQPAGAVYHGMSEDDVRRILRHPLTMIGSDGLPNDPHPHPRLWGTFPRVLGHYSRDLRLFPLSEAVRKMTSLSASRFGLTDRGLVRVGHWADLVLFDPDTIIDTATFEHPIRAAAGIDAVWVGGVLSYRSGQPTGQRNGSFLPRTGKRPGEGKGV
jgi:N-acyl-D-amino-acid deacylase